MSGYLQVSFSDWIKIKLKGQPSKIYGWKIIDSETDEGVTRVNLRQQSSKTNHT